MTSTATVNIDEVIDASTVTCIVIGYAGRDAESVQAHIDELAEIGVTPPPEIPMIYRMDAGLLTTDTSIVASAESSGEVEPVIVRSGGRFYLGVGSDHTDRKLEAEADILTSKLACPKPVSTKLVEIDLDTFDWDACQITCSVDGREIQRGGLDGLRTPQNILEILAERNAVTPDEDLVFYGGTVTLIGGEFVFGTEWTMTLTLPDGTVISHVYETKEK